MNRSSCLKTVIKTLQRHENPSLRSTGRLWPPPQTSHPCRPSTTDGHAMLGRSREMQQFPFTSQSSSSNSNNGRKSSAVYGSVASATISAIALAIYARDPLLTEAGARNDERKKKTKYIRLKDIKAHGADSQDGIWVSRGTSVYDITDWIGGHPGGSVIVRAAGGALEPYWSVFSFHQRPDIAGMLDEFKIGEVSIFCWH